MKIRTFLLVAAMPLSAQRPDFSGTWVAVPAEAPTTLPLAPSAILGNRFGLRLEGSAGTYTRVVREASFVTAIATDGSVGRVRVPARLCEGETEFHESVAWDGDALLLTITGTTPPGGPMQPANVRRILRLVSPDKLLVEATIVQRGERRQVGSIYRRTTDPLPPPRAPLPVTGLPATIDKVAWIGANWLGTNAQTTTEEHWTSATSGAMQAVTRTVRGTAMADFEFLCIAEREGTLVYNAMPDARFPATPFVLTALTSTSATFENPQHDYPKMVRYTLLADGSLETVVAGAGGARPQAVVLKKQP